MIISHYPGPVHDIDFSTALSQLCEKVTEIARPGWYDMANQRET